MRCLDCHHENALTAKVCSQCGAKLELSCAGCGAINSVSHKFCDQCGWPLREAKSAPTEANLDQMAPAAGREERRWATVLFADLSDFTTMSEQMDAEDVKALAHCCAERMSEQVQRFGGTLLNVVGDQIVAVFGAPLSHEDDAERAVRCGLAIRDSPLSGDPTRPVRVHVGINTGEVMAGVVGPRARRDYTLMGDVVNIAARLMSAAPAGSVLVGEETWRASRRGVVYRDLPPVAVKGKQRPLTVWEALEAAPTMESRPLGAAPLVGRDEELTMLSNVWLKVVREARPHLITVLGEPGIGKSRLVAEFERRFCAGALVLHGRCLPYGESLGYWALTSALKEAAGITAEAGTDTARLKLNELVSEALKPTQPEPIAEADAAEIACHLALLSGLDVTGTSPAKPIDQRVLHASVRRFLEALARRKPLCLMFEDIHWADDALLDLIEFVASRAKDVPLLIVAQARPSLFEKRPHWGGGVRAFTSLSLEALDEPAGQALIQALCSQHGLQASALEHIGRGAGGNPLFAEELVAMIAERGIGGGIPSAIKALISARLDSLRSDERNAIQLASVFGKVFWQGGLRALGGGDATAAMIEALEQKDLIRSQPRSQFRNDREYSFKHDLIRDVAYETLTRADRRILHGRVADWIEQAAGEHLEAYFDQLAHHALGADQDERALTFLQQAASRAHRMAAHREEAALLAQAIRIAEGLQKQALVTELHALRGAAFMGVAMWPEARPEFEAALAGLGLERIEARTHILVELASICFWTLDIPNTRRYATEALELTERANRDDLAPGAIAWLAAAEQSDGDLASARTLFRKAIARDESQWIAPFALFPLTLYLSGEIGEAIELGHKASQRFKDNKDTSSTMFGMPHLGLALAAGGRYEEAARVFAEGQKFGREYGIWPFLARSISMSAGFHLDVFDYAGNEARVEEARELGRSSGFQPSVISSSIDLLLNLARRHEVSRAEKLLEETAIAVRNTSGWHGWLWDLRLTQATAEIALARGDWQNALRWADESNAKSQARGRVKYRVAALGTLANALAALGRKHEAIVRLKTAVELARPVGDPALFLRPAAFLIDLDGNDALLAEVRATAKGILKALPAEEMRQRFANAEPLRVLGKFSD